MANPRSIVEWLHSLPIPWLVSRTVGYADSGSYGSVLDANVTTIKYGVQARFPTLAPADALPLIGNDRSLIQGGSIAGPSESDADFAERLRTFWETAAPFGGTPYAILQQLYYSLGYDNVYIVQQNGLLFHISTPPTDDPTVDLIVEDAMACATDQEPSPDRPSPQKVIPADSPWWRFDDRTDLCNRFAVLFPPDLPASWNDVTNPPTGTSAPSISEVNAIRQIIQRWRNAEAQCVGIIVDVGDGSARNKLWGFPNTNVWGQTGEVWGGQVVVFSP